MILLNSYVMVVNNVKSFGPKKQWKNRKNNRERGGHASNALNQVA